jgi:drug/metabolite transporter (DMT)-like permease
VSAVTPVNGAADDQRALAAASFAVFVWGFGPLLVRGVDASAGAIVFWRFLLAQPIMIGAAYLAGGRLSWPLIRRVLVPSVLFAGSMGAGFIAVQKTSIVNASLIGSLQPALLLIAAPLLFTVATSARQIAFALVAFGGITAVVVGAGATSGASLSGDVWAVVNLVMWTIYFVMVKRIRDEGVHAPSLIAAVFLVSGVMAAPFALFVSDDVTSIGGKGMLLLAAMAIGPGLVGHGLMTWSQKHLDIRVASLLGLLSPVISTIGAWIIYSQELRAVQIVGGMFVLAGLAGIVWDHRMTRAAELELEPA